MFMMALHGANLTEEGAVLDCGILASHTFFGVCFIKKTESYAST